MRRMWGTCVWGGWGKGADGISCWLLVAAVALLCCCLRQAAPPPPVKYEWCIRRISSVFQSR